MGVMKTPGVYIVEKNAFPNSIVEVATAVPAFIGYTAKAENNGKSLLNKPWRISSLAEFHQYFGGAPTAQFSIVEKTAPAPAAGAGAGAGAGAPAPAPAPATPQPVLPTAFMLGKREFALTQADAKDGGRFLLYASMRLFFQNGGGACYIVSVGNYDAPAIDATAITQGIELLIKEQEPTMVVVPDAVLLSQTDCITTVQQAMLAHCGGTMRSRVAILDVWGGFEESRGNDGCVAKFRDLLGINYLDFGAAYYPWVNTTVIQGNELSYQNIVNLDFLQSLIRAELFTAGTADPSNPKQLAQEKAIADLSKTLDQWLAEDTSSDTPESKQQTAKMQMALLNKTLAAMSPTFNTLLGEVRNRLNLLPPSAGMAGLYTMVDNTRGVWKAPANVSMAGVVSPAVTISAAEQEDLNVTTQGKSINAIRSFIGEGVLVWGARTLDGNSLDWRYVSVRRTMIMLEESCRLAAKALVFEPNVANTWITIKSMIQNFLTSIWKRGGLAGAVPDDAFSVHVGLGETMTPEDVLEGILRVTVLVAITRPAEFIEITFQQQMQKS